MSGAGDTILPAITRTEELVPIRGFYLESEKQKIVRATGVTEDASRLVMAMMDC